MTREEAIALMEHPSWQPLCREIDRLIETARTKIENADLQTVNIIVLQERIKALKGLKHLPDNVKDREE